MVSLLFCWVVAGMLFTSGPWTDKKRPFMVDYFLGMIILSLWPLVIVLRERRK